MILENVPKRLWRFCILETAAEKSKVLAKIGKT